MVLALENVENKKEMVRCQRRAVLPCKVVWGAPSIHQKWWVNTQTKPHCCKEKHQQALYVVLSWNPKQCDFLSKKMHTFCIRRSVVSNTHISKLKLPAQLSNFSCSTKSASIGKNNNTCTVQAESSKFASLSFDQVFLQDLRQVYQNRSECHLTVFCINPIVVYYGNQSFIKGGKHHY